MQVLNWIAAHPVLGFLGAIIAGNVAIGALKAAVLVAGLVTGRNVRVH